jgi:SH3 domain-containing kinase-binding protein 1
LGLGKEMCRVLFPYEAAHEDELTLQPDDIITLITKDGQDVGWWKGELKGKIGVFPDNFVEVIPVEEVRELIFLFSLVLILATIIE